MIIAHPYSNQDVKTSFNVMQPEICTLMKNIAASKNFTMINIPRQENCLL